MTAPMDPFEQLRAANPVDDDRLPAPARSVTARALYEQITGTPYVTGTASNRAPRRRWRLYLGSLVAVGGIGGGAAWAIASRHADKVLSVVCYARDDLTDGSVIGADGREPVAVCADAWRAGKVGPTPPAALAACVLPSGTVGVFPADPPNREPCAALGLPPAATTDPGEASALATVRTALIDRFRTAWI